jgi:phage baseplate assembly protein W
MYQPVYSDVNRVSPRTQPLVFDLESVKQSLDIILRTPKRQRLFYPWGQTLENILFSLDVQTLYRLRNVVFSALTQDPRVTLPYNNITLDAQPQQKTFTVTALFGIKGLTGQQFQQVWSIGSPS